MSEVLLYSRGLFLGPQRGTSLMTKRPPLGPYSRPMTEALWWSLGGGQVLMSEVFQYSFPPSSPPRTLQQAYASAFSFSS
jgi:hypothetical protein